MFFSGWLLARTALANTTNNNQKNTKDLFAFTHRQCDEKDSVCNETLSCPVSYDLCSCSSVLPEQRGWFPFALLLIGQTLQEQLYDAVLASKAAAAAVREQEQGRGKQVLRLILQLQSIASHPLLLKAASKPKAASRLPGACVRSKWISAQASRHVLSPKTDQCPGIGGMLAASIPQGEDGSGKELWLKDVF
jgi:hypothetical protein